MAPFSLSLGVKVEIQFLFHNKGFIEEIHITPGCELRLFIASAGAKEKLYQLMLANPLASF